MGLALVLAGISILGDRGRIEFVRGRLDASPEKSPPATVIVPVKGAEEGLRANLESLAQLDYPDFELIVTARREEDIPPGVVPPKARIAISGDGDSSTGEKINNLIAAVASAHPRSAIFAFADSDGQVQPGWLRGLVSGLEREKAGASSGYRVYLPARAGFWPICRSIWNAVIGGGFGAGDNRFAWGGGMAIRRDLFQKLKVVERWRGSVSDDYALSAAVHDAGLHIVYEPLAQVISSGGTGGAEFLSWVRRQMVITRVYAPRLWGLALFAHLVYCAAMAASMAVSLQGNLTGVYTLVAQLLLSFWKGANRLQIMRLSLPDQRPWLRRHGWTHVWLVPLGTWLWLFGLLASAMTNVIEWRGNRYRLNAARLEKL